MNPPSPNPEGSQMKSKEEWLEQLCEGVAGHTCDCICERCKNGQEAFILLSDIEAIQQNAYAAGRAIAEEDTKMLDWLETNQYAIGFPSDGEFGKTGWSLFFDGRF